MLIALAGLPGTGKSTLAAALERKIDAIVLDKDRVRAVLFPPRVLDYSDGQDEMVMTAIYQATTAILSHPSAPAVILDGRTYLRPGQQTALLKLAASVPGPLKIITCVCDDAVVKERLERDLAEGCHSARNRTFALYQRIKAEAVPITVPHLVLDTGRLSLAECVARCRAYVIEP